MTTYKMSAGFSVSTAAYIILHTPHNYKALRKTYGVA